MVSIVLIVISITTVDTVFEVIHSTTCNNTAKYSEILMICQIYIILKTMDKYD